MNKKLQYVIAFSCLLVAGSIAHYFVSYIPEKNVQSLEKDCYKMATDRKNQDSEELSNSTNSVVSSDSQYAFDSKEKRCLYKYMSVSIIPSKDGSVVSRLNSIIELNRNIEIAGYSSMTTDKIETVLSGNKIEFETIDKKFFSK